MKHTQVREPGSPSEHTKWVDNQPNYPCVEDFPSTGEQGSTPGSTNRHTHFVFMAHPHTRDCFVSQVPRRSPMSDGFEWLVEVARI